MMATQQIEILEELSESSAESQQTNEIACQTEPNLIDKLVDSSNSRKQRLEDVDLYQEYVRSAQCTQFWPLDKNPIRTLVPAMIKVDLPEQHLKNESLMFDLVQAISNNSKLVNLLAKYIHHIVPNVIISKRIDLIPLITCTIRVCREQSEQERLVGLLFNLIKRPNEEQRRMILSGLIVVLQVSPSQDCAMLLPNLWDHVNDKFPERRILLAESCASLANYVRPALRTNLILSILIQLLKDKNAAVRSAACKSFACLLTLIMDTNDEVFDACLAAAEDLIQDVLQQTPMSFCEHRYELEEMRFCALESVYPLVCMWSVKLNRFKHELAQIYLAKTEKYLANLLTGTTNQSSLPSPMEFSFKFNQSNEPKIVAAAEVARRRSIFLETRNKRQSSSTDSGLSTGTPPSPAPTIARPSLASNLFAAARRQSAAFVTSAVATGAKQAALAAMAPTDNQALITAQKAVCAYLKMVTYLVPYVFADSVQSCAWLSKPSASNPQQTSDSNSGQSTSSSTSTSSSDNISSNNTIINNYNNIYNNKLLDPSLILDASAIVAFHDQIESMHLVESHDWMLDKFLPQFLKIIATFSQPRLQVVLGLTNSSQTGGPTSSVGSSSSHQTSGQPTGTGAAVFSAVASTTGSSSFNHSALLTDLLTHCLGSIRNLCLLFGSSLTKSKIRPIIRNTISAYRRHDLTSINNNKNYYQTTTSSNSNTNNSSNILISTNLKTNSSSNSIGGSNNNSDHNAPITLYTIYLAALTAFEPIEQQEFEQLVSTIGEALTNVESLTRVDVEMLAISIRIIATSPDQIQSPSTRQKFLTYTLDALVRHSIKFINSGSSTGGSHFEGGPISGSIGNKFVNALTKGSNNLKFASKANDANNNDTNNDLNNNNNNPSKTKPKEFMLIIFRHILTCLIDPAHRPADWAQILVTKFLPTLIALANDSTDVYICTYARLMCAKLVETFDLHFNNPKLTREQAQATLPALESLKALTEQIKASNLKRQIEFLLLEYNDKF